MPFYLILLPASDAIHSHHSATVVTVNPHILLENTISSIYSTCLSATHIAEVASPELRALVAEPELDVDTELLFGEDLRCTRLINRLWLAVHEHREGLAAIGRDEGNGHTRGVERLAERDRARRGKDPAPASG
jgi:hypothetical protein